MGDWKQRLTDDWLLSDAALLKIGKAFCAQMKMRLAGQDASLKMLPAHLAMPTGSERGEFLALDFGGTHLRALKVQLPGTAGGGPKLMRVCRATLRQAQNAAELFDFAAELVLRITDGAAGGKLGHTFSFPVCQDSLQDGRLIHWTKEIKVPGVEGRRINELLQQAFCRSGASIEPIALINDTVGTLLTAAYVDERCDIGSICGTGHNTAYLERSHPNGRPMIVNIEAGNFDDLPFNRFDQMLARQSAEPQKGRLEKMTSGRYLGEVMRLAVQEWKKDGVVLQHDHSEILNGSGAISTEMLSRIVAGEAQAALLEIGLRASARDALRLRELAAAVLQRSARLAAASYIGILLQMDPQLKKEHRIAVDGSLYEKAPGYAAAMNAALAAWTGSADCVATVRCTDGSGCGAAIAAALSSA